MQPLDLYNVRDSLSAEEQAVQESVARLVDDKVLPIIAEVLREHRFPRELVPIWQRSGCSASSLEGYGCAGLNAVSSGLICQELERGDSALRSFVSVQSSLCMFPIYSLRLRGTESRSTCRAWPRRVIGCFGLTEPHGGSDPANMKTHAKKRRGGDWVINGAKMWITNGAIADLCICVGDD
jgi:glutaryl-CoA dehydrogenase